MLPTDLTVSAVVENDGKFLLVEERASGVVVVNQPGGHIEAGESPEQALTRELAEELSINVTKACLAPLTFASFDYDTFHLLMPLFVCRRWSGMVRAREGQTLKWVRPSSLREFSMPPADEPLITSLVDLL